MPFLSTIDDVHINRWKPPEGNSYKLNSDASFTMGEMDFGAIVHNSNSEPLISMQKALQFNIVELTEAAAFLNDIVTALEAGTYPLCVETNSMIIWNLLEGQDCFNNEL